MKKLFKKPLSFVFVFLIVVLGIIGLSPKKKPQDSFNAKKAKTTLVQKGNLSNYLTLAGKVDARIYANLQFQTSSLLSWVGVKEGDRVKKYQAIASLDKTSLKKQLDKQLNNYLTNRWNFEDTQDEYKQTKENYLITTEIQRILDRTQFSLNNSVLDVEISDLALRYATLTSPIEGIVTHVDQPNAGVNIIPTSATFTVIDPASIFFKSSVDESDVSLIKEGQATIIVLDSFSDDNLISNISSISFTPVLGETSTTYTVSFDLPVDNNNLQYRIGMNGDAKILLEEAKDTLYLPIETVSEKNRQKFVYIKNPKGKIEERAIKTGIENDDYIQIVEGLTEGESVFYNPAL